MSNPLKIFQILLEKGNALDPSSTVETNNENLSIYDEDITTRIGIEGGVALMNIDSTYWKNMRDDNGYFIARLLNSADRLISIADNSLGEHIQHIVTRTDTDSWLIHYNNLQAVHANLIKIRTTIIESYSIDVPSTYKVDETTKNYPVLNEAIAIELRKECISNIGIKDTLFRLTSPNIEVRTGGMSVLLKELVTEKIPLNHAENIIVLEKIAEKNPVKTTSEEPMEKMEYNGTVESLGLFYSLLFEVKLINSENSKSKVGRILANTIKIAEKNTEFTERSITDMFNVKNRKYDSKNLPFIKGKLIQMLSIVQKLDKN